MTTTTTQILFNSPALHSLKRDQLVKLCKIHSIKANGKNVELVERLKQYALGLPATGALTALGTYDDDDPMEGVEEQGPEAQIGDEDVDVDIPGGMPADDSKAMTGVAPHASGQNADGEDYDMHGVVLTSRFAIPRPSEQWEIVMDDIEEVDETTLGTASSKNSLRTVNGEFGTHSSKSTVSSSIKALATSLGIKRVSSKSSQHTQNTDIQQDELNPKMPSFSPGKLFNSSAKARDSLAAHATPYSDIPQSESLPDTDVFKFSTPDASILGIDDDADDGDNRDEDNADVKSIFKPTLRLGGGMKSTIRLVSQTTASRSANNAYMSPPRLPVVKTDFDLTVGTPGTMRSLNMWPASPRAADPGAKDRLYPALPIEDLKNTHEGDDSDGMSVGTGIPTATPAKKPAQSAPFLAARTLNTSGPVDEPDMFSPAKPKLPAVAGPATPGGPAPHPPIPRSTPFLFGSPLPRREPGSAIKSIERNKHLKDDGPVFGVSNAAFDGVAKSVLEEMHRRVAEAKAQNGETASRPLPAPPIFGGAVTFAASGQPQPQQDRFAKAHETQFSKMDSIANHYAARRPNKRKSDALGHGRPVAGQKRRSSAAGARVISAGSRKRMAVPGGFGGEDESDEDDEGGGADVRGEADDDDDDVGARRSSKRMRVTQGWDVHRGQRVSLAPPMAPAEEEKKQKEREAVKRELDAAKARRRSSRGRPSMGAPPAKGKASRFGFLASAKSLVRNVWNMGGNSKAKSTAIPSGIPVPKASQAQPPAEAGITEKKAEKGKSDAAPKQPPSVAGNTRKASGSQPRTSSLSSTSNKLLKPNPSVPTTESKTGTLASTKSTNSRSRSPIPPFAAPSGTVKSTGTAVSRSSSIAGTARSRVSNTGTSTSTGTATSRQMGRTSTVSSLGTRTSVASGSSAAVSSIGTRQSLVSPSNTASTSSKDEQPAPRKRTSSLLAPTASSLAKANATVKPSLAGRTSGLPPVAEAQQPKRASITQASSSRPSAHNAVSPRPTRIFSQPLTNFASPASSSSGAPHQPSLAAAARSIMDASEAASSPSKIPRPAVLPPKPKQLVARRPRISRSRVIAKLGAQRAAAAQGSSSLGSPAPRTRSSLGAAAARRSFGGIKSGGGRASGGGEAMRAAVKKRARQSEYTRRKSRATNENFVDDD